MLLAIQNWAVSESMVVLKKNDVDLHKALEAINESSGRSWSSMQRMPDNILTRKFDYGFSLGLHRKDVESAYSLMQTEGGVMNAPMMSQTRLMMSVAVKELGEDADHVEVAKLVERWNDVTLE
jgi:3-hydroxyisobutyrate dehydrogenase